MTNDYAPPRPSLDGAVPYYVGAPYRVVMSNAGCEDLGAGMMVSGSVLKRHYAEQLLLALNATRQEGWTVHLEQTEIYGDNVFGTSRWAPVDE